jgi:hypothetical protein
MRSLMLLGLGSLMFSACVATAPDDGAPGSRPGGGKADDGWGSCPVSGADEIIDAIAQAGNCYTAAELAEACAFGAGIDVQFVGEATAVCDRGFSAMTAVDKARYDGLLARCTQKYASESGSMYRSATAFCQLEVTRLFAELFPELEAGEPVVPFVKQCPINEGSPDQIVAAIERADSCWTASNLAEACAWGSLVDLQFTSAASQACSTSPLDADDLALRDELARACAARYDEEGTMYRSMAAYCVLQVAVVLDAITGSPDF